MEWVRNGHQARERGNCRELPPIETPAVPYPPALMEGDKWCLLQKTTILAPNDQHMESVYYTAKLYHSLANIGRVLWECQRDGSRSDGAVENLGLIREPAGKKLVPVYDHNKSYFKESHTSGRPGSVNDL